jgi:NADP-dependent 3-hydroxy acid dehydrogenase YdfG
MEIKNKVAIVTGASKGIGRQTALDLAAAGASVAVSARSGDLLESLAGEIRQRGGSVLVFKGDMSVEEEIIAFIRKTAESFGKIDILVNNAGVGYMYPIAELSTRHWDEMFNLNIRGLFIATREALPYLRMAGESVIVNIASVAGKNAFVNGGGYAPSKHAVLAFSRCLMLEERKNGIRVLAICPGSVTTNFADRQPELGLLAPEDRALKPADISDAILHAIRMPQRAMISEIDIRPTSP